MSRSRSAKPPVPPASPALPDFVATVRDNIAEYGNERTFTFVSELKGPGRQYCERKMGFADLDLRARALACRLHALGLRDSAVLLLYPEGLEFIVAFLGCLYARVVAVPAPLPELDAGRSGRTRRIIGDADVTWILTDAAHCSKLDDWLEDEGLTGKVHCLATDVGIPATVDTRVRHWTMPDHDAGTLAFLQYTSGSTSDPKGVMVTHGNLAHNAEEIKRSIKGSSDTIGVGWIPHYHDMGLIGQVLEPLYLGCSYIFSSPITFIKRPVLWLELIDYHRASNTVAPNFGYELLLRRVTDAQLADLDLSCLKVAQNGAEPVRADTLEKMIERLGPYGFRPEAWAPCYGMAETTLLVTCAPAGTGPIIRDFDAAQLTHNTAVLASASNGATPAVSNGATTTTSNGTSAAASHGASAAAMNGTANGTANGAVPGALGEGAVRRLVSSGRAVTLDVRIVDPENRVVLPDRRVGEIWVRGGSVADGYRLRPEATEEIFNAHTADGAGPYLRTGDLGFLDDGELYVTGRIKDLIIVNGRNIYAHDLEEAALSTHPAIRTAAAFAVTTDSHGEPGLEHVIIVQEVSSIAARDTTLTDLASLTKETVAFAFGLPALSVVLSERGAVRRTTSGKIQRHLTRKAFLDGKIKHLAGDLEPGVAALHPVGA